MEKLITLETIHQLAHKENQNYWSIARFIGEGISPLEFIRLPLEPYLEGKFTNIPLALLTVLCYNEVVAPRILQRLSTEALRKGIEYNESGKGTPRLEREFIDELKKILAVKERWDREEANDTELRDARLTSRNLVKGIKIGTDKYHLSKAAGKVTTTYPWPMGVAGEIAHTLQGIARDENPGSSPKDTYWEELLSFLGTELEKKAAVQTGDF